MDLRLSGSQINLVTRPKQTREPSRPNSAISAFCRRPDSIDSEVHRRLGSFSRPYSADSPVMRTLHRPKSAGLKAKLEKKNDFDLISRKIVSKSNINVNRKPINNFTTSSKLLESLLSEPLTQSWDTSEFEIRGCDSPKTSSDDSLGTKIQSLAQDASENQENKFFSSEYMSSNFCGSHKLNDNLKNRRDTYERDTKSAVQFSDNIEVFSKSDNSDSDGFIEETFPNQYDDDNLLEANGDSGMPNITPGLAKKPPLPHIPHKRNTADELYDNSNSDDENNDFLSQSNLSLALSLNDQNNKTRFSNEQYEKDTSFRTWTERQNKTKTDILGRVSFYKESEKLNFNRDSVIEDNGDSLSIEDDPMLQNYNEDFNNVSIPVQQYFDQENYLHNEITTDRIIEDYKNEVEYINSVHNTSVEKEICENGKIQLPEVRNKNEDDEITAINEHFKYLDQYENNFSNNEKTEDGFLENNEDHQLIKMDTPEIVEIKVNPTNLSNYFENESEISNEGVINDYRIAIGEISKPVKDLTKANELLPSNLETKTNELLLSMVEITNESNEVINKYLKVKNDCAEKLKNTDTEETFVEFCTSYRNVNNNEIKACPKKPPNNKKSYVFKKQSLVKKLEKVVARKQEPKDDLHISEVKNNDVESWMSQSLHDLDICAHLDISETPEHDCQIEANFHLDKDNDYLPQNSTYNEIVSILKEIENEDDKSMLRVENMKHEAECKLNDILIEANNQYDDQFPSKSKEYRDILCYLDEVDMDCNNALQAVKSRVKTTPKRYVSNNAVSSHSSIEELPKLHDLLTLSTSELADRVLSLSVQLHERTCCVQLLNDALAQKRGQYDKDIRMQQKAQNEKIRSQRHEYEAIVSRHQKFIDQLISDKKSLSDQCERLTLEMRNAENRHTNNSKAAQQRHEAEIQREKDKMAAAEKIRRDRWIETKTQKIKEMTVKGLESEINSMKDQHNAEITELTIKHEKFMREASQKNLQNAQKQLEKERDELVKEKERALERERERFEHQFESEQKSLEALRARLKSELIIEKQRVNEEVRILRDEIELLQKRSEHDRARAAKEAEIEWKQSIQELEKKHQIELQGLHHTLHLELEAHRASLSKQYTATLSESEKEIREASRLERDRQIERVIERIEIEAQSAKRAAERNAEILLRRQKEQYLTEMTELERTDKGTKEKLSEVKNKLSEAEDMILSLQSNLKHMEMQHRHTQKICDNLSEEREIIRDQIRAEFSTQLLCLQNQMAEMRKARDAELQQVYARVKLAVAKKDSSLQLLQAEHERLQEKCSNLEKTVHEQRKQYFIK